MIIADMSIKIYFFIRLTALVSRRIVDKELKMDLKSAFKKKGTVVYNFLTINFKVNNSLI